MDWGALGVIALAALRGLRRGLIGTVLSLAGLAGGAVLGYRLAPHVVAGSLGLPTYIPLVPLIGAIVGGSLLAAAGSVVAALTRSGLHLVAPLRWLDSLGGMLAGAAWGVVLVWVLGAVALELPDDPSLRREARDSGIVRGLDTLVSPDDLLCRLGRVDRLSLGSAGRSVTALRDPCAAAGTRRTQAAARLSS